MFRVSQSNLLNQPAWIPMLLQDLTFSVFCISVHTSELSSRIQILARIHFWSKWARRVWFRLQSDGWSYMFCSYVIFIAVSYSLGTTGETMATRNKAKLGPQTSHKCRVNWVKSTAVFPLTVGYLTPVLISWKQTGFRFVPIRGSCPCWLIYLHGGTSFRRLKGHWTTRLRWSL